MSDGETINICLSSDDNYAKHAGVVIASILYNANSDDNLIISILDGGISEKYKNEILSLKSIKNCEINFIKIDNAMFDIFKDIQTHAYISLPAYFRLKMPTFLPEAKKVIYLDCDVIVNTSLKELYETDIDNYLLAGVLDSKRRMIKKNPTYINTGVLLINIEKLREDNLENKVLEYAKQNAKKIKFGDQEIINDVCKGKIKLIDKEWNVQSSNFVNRSCYTHNPKIIHFVSQRKPWHFGSFSYHKNFYFKYLQLTPWKLDEK